MNWFQSPYGGKGGSDVTVMTMSYSTLIGSFNHLAVAGVGQTLGFLRYNITHNKFQSPCGGIGALDNLIPKSYSSSMTGFNHLTVAGVGQTGVHKQRRI